MADLEIVGTSPISKGLYALRRIAIATTGIGDAERISVGYKRWAEDKDFEDLVLEENRETQGFVSLQFARYNAEEEDVSHLFVNAELVVHVPKHDSSWMSDAFDLAHLLLSNWMDESNWLAGEGRLHRAEFTLREIRTIETGGLAYFDFGPDGTLDILTIC